MEGEPRGGWRTAASAAACAPVEEKTVDPWLSVSEWEAACRPKKWGNF